MDGADQRFDSYADFYRSEYSSVITRVTPLPFATLFAAEQTAGDWSDKPTPDLVFVRVASGERTFSADFGAGRFDGRHDANVTVVVAPHVHSSIQCTGRHNLQLVGLPFSQLNGLAGDDLRLPADGDFGPLHSGMIANPIFGHMIAAMFEIANPAYPVAGLFFENMLLAMLAKLVLETGKPMPVATGHRGGLADWQVKRVREALCGAHGNFDLTSLAGTVGLSPYHFCRAFKQSTGMPPYRYQIMLRIERAKDLLARTSLPMSDVAAAIGYEDQSHFAQMFRRGVGVTPSQYRRERRS